MARSVGIELDARVIQMKVEMDNVVEDIRGLEYELVELEELFKAQLQQLKDRFEERQYLLQQKKEKLQTQLRFLFEQVPQSETKTQRKVKLLNGDVVVKKPKLDFEKDGDMAKAICIIGESGAGKTTSLRNLDPREMYYIDADKKGSAWRGFRQQYNAANKNYIATDDPNKVLALMKGISEKNSSIKYIVIDTLNGIMIGEEMRRSKEKNFDKWLDLASYIYNILVGYKLLCRNSILIVS